MKLLLATYEYPPDLGGVASYLGGLFGALPKESVEILRLKPPKGPFAWLWQMPKLWLASRAADAVVVSHFLPLGTAALMLRKPYVVIVHGLDLRTAAAQPRKKELAERVLKNARLLIANSHATASELSAFGIDPFSALILTPCPTRSELSDRIKTTTRSELTDRIKTATRSELSDRINVTALELEGKRVLLSVGRFVARKGFDRLIRLLPELRKSCGDVVLVIAGAGAEEGRLRSDAALSGVERHVRFVIAPDRETLDSLYSAADVFALAVRASKGDIEGFGLVFLEAASFGVPSVSSRIGGVPEAIVDGQTGLLADPDSDSDLYEKLRRLLNDPDEAARLGQAARARVLSDFLWKDRAALLLKRLS